MVRMHGDMMIGDNNPTHLHHYTSIRGVEGILASKSVRASLLHFMNDSKEWLYALDFVRSALQHRLRLRDDKHWLSFLAELTQSLSRIQGLNICAFSLTEMPNQLSQWRAYCPPEGGYNLSFDTSFLREHLGHQNFNLRRCVYDVAEQQRIVAEVVESALGLVGKLDDEKAIEGETDRGLRRLVELLSPVAPVFKHPDFKEEQEWRAFAVVLSTDPRMKYHIKGSVAVPFCELALETRTVRFPLSGITVGPNAHQDLAFRGLRAILEMTGVQVPIGRSSTPLRNL